MGVKVVGIINIHSSSIFHYIENIPVSGTLEVTSVEAEADLVSLSFSLNASNPVSETIILVL
jgi:hypothetical protein